MSESWDKTKLNTMIVIASISGIFGGAIGSCAGIALNSIYSGIFFGIVIAIVMCTMGIIQE